MGRPDPALSPLSPSSPHPVPAPRSCGFVKGGSGEATRHACFVFGLRLFIHTGMAQSHAPASRLGAAKLGWRGSLPRRCKPTSCRLISQAASCCHPPPNPPRSLLGDCQQRGLPLRRHRPLRRPGGRRQLHDPALDPGAWAPLRCPCARPLLLVVGAAPSLPASASLCAEPMVLSPYCWPAVRQLRHPHLQQVRGSGSLLT